MSFTLGDAVTSEVIREIAYGIRLTIVDGDDLIRRPPDRASLAADRKIKPMISLEAA